MGRLRGPYDPSLQLNNCGSDYLHYLRLASANKYQIGTTLLKKGGCDACSWHGCTHGGISLVDISGGNISKNWLCLSML